jgi:hypothetical protein
MSRWFTPRRWGKPAPPTSAPVWVASGGFALSTAVQTPAVHAGVTLSVTAAFLMQATQEPDASACLVANRPALARCTVQASAANALQPAVSVQLYDATDTLLGTYPLSKAAGVPTAPTTARGDAFEATLPAQAVVPGVKAVFQVTHTQPDQSALRWPAHGFQSYTVYAPPAIHLTFVPVETSDGRLGVLSEATRASTLALVASMFPLAAVTSSVRAPYVSSAGPLLADDSNSAWLSVLSQLNALRTTDGASTTTHYCGVLNPSYGGGVAGYAYVPGRTLVVWDKPGTIGAVFAHELGHNLNLRHSAGCGAAGVDTLAQSTLGGVGWRADTNAWFLPGTQDIMNYCSSQWTTRYGWNRAAAWRGNA